MCFLTSPRQTSLHGAQDGAAHFVLPPAASVRRRRLVVLQARPLRFALAHCDPAHVALAPCPARQMAGEQAPRLLVVGPRQQRRELAEASVGLRCRQPRHRREVHARDCPRQSGRRHKVPALDARDARSPSDRIEHVERRRRVGGDGGAHPGHARASPIALQGADGVRLPVLSVLRPRLVVEADLLPRGDGLARHEPHRAAQLVLSRAGREKVWPALQPSVRRRRVVGEDRRVPRQAVLARHVVAVAVDEHARPRQLQHVLAVARLQRQRQPRPAVLTDRLAGHQRRPRKEAAPADAWALCDKRPRRRHDVRRRRHPPLVEVDDERAVGDVGLWTCRGRVLDEPRTCPMLVGTSKESSRGVTQRGRSKRSRAHDDDPGGRAGPAAVRGARPG
mmetsp:Transcript_46066/g.149766  ORF Transcript_46066/g.149766 Transcript_46066/m.149766 type:complete len:392 (+) Transcript_46066:333-1508(+)